VEQDRLVLGGNGQLTYADICGWYPALPRFWPHNSTSWTLGLQEALLWSWDVPAARLTWAGRVKAFVMLFELWHETSESAFDYPSTSQQCHTDIINDPVNHGYTINIGKLYEFTNLKCWAILGWFPLTSINDDSRLRENSEAIIKFTPMNDHNIMIT